jgi:hypothetical protein
LTIPASPCNEADPSQHKHKNATLLPDLFFVKLLYDKGAAIVGIAMGCRLDGRSSIPAKHKRFPLLHSIQTGSGAHPSKGYLGVFPGE